MVGIPMEVDRAGGQAADLMSAPPADMAAPQQIQRATVQYENTVRLRLSADAQQHDIVDMLGRLDGSSAKCLRSVFSHQAGMLHPACLSHIVGAALSAEGEGLRPVCAELLRAAHGNESSAEGGGCKGVPQHPRCALPPAAQHSCFAVLLPA